MKPFHYNQDPLYAAAASILTGQQQLTEEVVAFKNEGFKLVNGLMSDEDIHDAVNSTIKSVSQKLGDSTWDVVTDIYGKRENGEWGNDWILQRKGGGAWLTIKDGGPFKAHDSISSVLSFFKIEEEMKLIKKAELTNTSANLNAKFKAGQTIKVTTRHHDGRSSFDKLVTTYTIDKVNRETIDITDEKGNKYRFNPEGNKVDSIEIIKEADEQEMEEAKGDVFAPLIGKKVHHGSPGYPTPEVIASITPHQTQSGKFEIEFESGTFDVLSMDDLDELMNGAEVHFKSPHGGITVIELKEDEEMEEAKDDLKSLSLDQLKSQLASLDNQIGRLEDKQGFAPEELKAEFRAIDAEIQLRKGIKEGDEDYESLGYPTNYSLAQLQTRLASLDNQIGRLEDKQGFAPEELKAEFRAVDAEVKRRKGIKEGDEGFYSQKMIKNQLQTIVRNSNTCLEMIGAGREFPEWAQSEIAVAEDGIVSVTEFMQSHNSDKKEIDESPSPFKMGTATITAPGHKLDGKHVHIFHKFDDGRINVQYPKSDKKGDVLNITLTKGQYKLDDEVMSEEYTIKTSGARAAMEKFTMLDAVELEDFLKAASMYFAEEGESEGAFTNLAELFGKAAKAWSNRKGN